MPSFPSLQYTIRLQASATSLSPTSSQLPFLGHTVPFENPFSQLLPTEEHIPSPLVHLVLQMLPQYQAHPEVTVVSTSSKHCPHITAFTLADSRMLFLQYSTQTHLLQETYGEYFTMTKQKSFQTANCKAYSSSTGK